MKNTTIITPKKQQHKCHQCHTALMPYWRRFMGLCPFFLHMPRSETLLLQLAIRTSSHFAGGPLPGKSTNQGIPGLKLTPGPGLQNPAMEGPVGTGFAMSPSEEFHDFPNNPSKGIDLLRGLLEIKTRPRHRNRPKFAHQRLGASGGRRAGQFPSGLPAPQRRERGCL